MKTYIKSILQALKKYYFKTQSVLKLKLFSFYDCLKHNKKKIKIHMITGKKSIKFVLTSKTSY